VFISVVFGAVFIIVVGIAACIIVVVVSAVVVVTVFIVIKCRGIVCVDVAVIIFIIKRLNSINQGKVRSTGLQMSWSLLSMRL